jgi:hypothetical protein
MILLYANNLVILYVLQLSDQIFNRYKNILRKYD